MMSPSDDRTQRYHRMFRCNSHDHNVRTRHILFVKPPLHSRKPRCSNDLVVLSEIQEFSQLILLLTTSPLSNEMLRVGKTSSQYPIPSSGVTQLSNCVSHDNTSNRQEGHQSRNLNNVSRTIKARIGIPANPRLGSIPSASSPLTMCRISVVPALHRYRRPSRTLHHSDPCDRQIGCQ